MGDLKPGWKRYRFGDMVLSMGATRKARGWTASGSGVNRYVGLEHLDSNSLKIQRWGSPDDVGENSDLRHFEPGDVILARRGIELRKVGAAEFRGVASGHALVFRAKAEVVLPEFLPFFMQSDAFMLRADRFSVGSLSRTVNLSVLTREEFALPPLKEQRRITALLSSLAEGDAATRTLSEAADKQRKAYLISIFRPDRGTRDRYPAHWRIGTVDDAGEVQLGQKRDPSVHHGTNMRPYLRVANVFDDEFDLSDVLTMHFAERDLPKYLLRDGDILLNEGQSTDLLGRSAIWRGQIENMCFQMTLLRFRARSGVVPEFAHAFFQHMLYTKQFAKDALQTTSIAHLSASKFGRMLFPVPPMDDQKAIVRKYEALRAGHRSAQARANATRHLYRLALRGVLPP